MRKYMAVCAAALLAAGGLAACSGESGEDFAGSARGEHLARFVQQPWADLVVETSIARNILDQLGYQTSTQEVSVPLGAQALHTGQADAYLGNWWPSQRRPFSRSRLRRRRGRRHAADRIGVCPGCTRLCAQSLSVRSLADLDAHADEFGREILGIEPGAPGNTTIQNAIKADAYGLGDWKLTESSTEAMLAEVDRRVAQNKPVVFLGWSPHWMTIEWDLTFLADPEKVWPGAGEIRVLQRKGPPAPTRI